MELDVKGCEQIILELEYKKDIRKYPDNFRRGQFKLGWEDVVIRQQIYSPITLQKLTWRNLGYRTGILFGNRSVNEINQVFELFARQYKNVMDIEPSSWQNDIEKWVGRHRKLPDASSQDLIRFFELVFEHTQHPDEAWFGVHEQTVSLVVGGIFLAAINLSNPDYGIWLLVDQNSVAIPKVEYKPVKSTQKYDPLTWSHLSDVMDISLLFKNPEFWLSYSQASKKILNSPISRAHSAEFQRGRHKRCLNEFWKNSLEKQNDLADLRDKRQKIEAEGYFDVNNIEDARRRLTVSIVQRQGKSEFRRKLLTAYDGRCAISGCDAEAAIEAAHIIPYQGAQTNHITNGLPLRADLHTLFDLYLLSIQPDTYEIIVAPELIKTCYQELIGQKLTLPKDSFALPSRDALRKHYDNFLQNYALAKYSIT
jgi:putative restriction endonuclease